MLLYRYIHIYTQIVYIYIYIIGWRVFASVAGDGERMESELSFPLFHADLSL